MFEEDLIGLAEIVQAPVFRVVETLLGAAAPAAVEPPAFPAGFGEIGFLTAELCLPGGVQHVDEALRHRSPPSGEIPGTKKPNPKQVETVATLQSP